MRYDYNKIAVLYKREKKRYKVRDLKMIEKYNSNKFRTINFTFIISIVSQSPAIINSIINSIINIVISLIVNVYFKKRKKLFSNNFRIAILFSEPLSHPGSTETFMNPGTHEDINLCRKWRNQRVRAE